MQLDKIKYEVSAEVTFTKEEFDLIYTAFENGSITNKVDAEHGGWMFGMKNRVTRALDNGREPSDCISYDRLLSIAEALAAHHYFNKDDIDFSSPVYIFKHALLDKIKKILHTLDEAYNKVNEVE
ncbi:hypothetical protein I2I11_04270 [Pontibacter sp. 172403-2]|uniref:hypothetical protein n=1 Tax=Pontibacter rufus TaxID=2791028 RepID=UPI0018AFE6A1|nr:hypothetical protein [Pontibacter sp. 172403-2]MBF9252500.1 hypothetical protein [Pontibacter sp. 172403-2]